MFDYHLYIGNVGAAAPAAEEHKETPGSGDLGGISWCALRDFGGEVFGFLWRHSLIWRVSSLCGPKLVPRMEFPLLQRLSPQVPSSNARNCQQRLETVYWWLGGSKGNPQRYIETFSNIVLIFVQKCSKKPTQLAGCLHLLVPLGPLNMLAQVSIHLFSPHVLLWKTTRHRRWG